MFPFGNNTIRISIILAVSAFLLGVYFFIFLNSSVAPSEPLPLPQNPAYRDAGIPVEVRIDDLLSYMTLEEKVGQMALVEKNSIKNQNDIASYGIGALLSGAGAKPEDNSREGWNTMVSDFINTSKESRLGIPLIYGADAIHGHSNVPGATVFPHSIGLGATGDAKLVEDIAHATAEELKATGIRWSFSPNLDMPKDIRWGRTYEAFSDDPMLTATLGAAYVRGTQNEKLENTTASVLVLSTPKHYVGAGSMVWGSSSNENFKIDQGRTSPDETALRTEYLVPFKAAVDAGAMSMMVGLNSWGDTKLSANEYLITDVLKGELDFNGFVVSDWYGVYEIPGGDYKAAVTAINAGVDMVMLPFAYEAFVENVTYAVKRGAVSEARINDAVRRILRAKFALGLFDTSGTTELNTIGSKEHRTLAREAVSKSLVLLKNEESVLPIKNTVTHIRVAGSAADNVGRQAGAWTVEWQGIDGNWLSGGTSILSGIRARAPNGVLVEYKKDGAFESEAELADLGIAIVGEAPYAEGWGDRENPTLDAADRAVIERLTATSKKVVVVIVSGRPLIITDEISSWNALIAAWLPGSEGAGVADVLFGDVRFGGHLPLPWPLNISQLPVRVDGQTKDGTPHLFPRYFGLSK